MTEGADEPGWVCDRCGRGNPLAVEFCNGCGADGGMAARVTAFRQARRAARFPSTPETRRAILDAVARSHEKYARPFDRRTVAQVSYFGTDSWAEYGEVVLQMAMLDTLISVEAKLAELLGRLGDPPSVA